MPAPLDYDNGIDDQSDESGSAWNHSAEDAELLKHLDGLGPARRGELLDLERAIRRC